MNISEQDITKYEELRPLLTDSKTCKKSSLLPVTFFLRSPSDIFHFPVTELVSSIYHVWSFSFHLHELLIW